mgnify:CR=1 FL=1
MHAVLCKLALDVTVGLLSDIYAYCSRAHIVCPCRATCVTDLLARQRECRLDFQSPVRVTNTPSEPCQWEPCKPQARAQHLPLTLWHSAQRGVESDSRNNMPTLLWQIPYSPRLTCLRPLFR